MSAPSLLSATSRSLPPDVAAAAGTGFKDWALVCAALGSGRQSLILRKGGIAEGREGFRFKHEAFYLFPTQYHQQAEWVRQEELANLGPVVAPPAGTVEIRYFFALDWAVWIDDWPTLARLEPFHVWRDDVVRERFEYDGQRGLQCAFGRVYRLGEPWTFADRPSYGGCRSWVSLPPPPAGLGYVPVLDDARHEAAANALRSVVKVA